MLLAPFTLTEIFVDRRANNQHCVSEPPPWLLAWVLGGIVAVVLFPSLRGGDLTGLSMPFWLVGAPLINLAWLARGQAMRMLRTLTIRRTGVAATQPRVPSRLRSMRRRNSAMMRR